MIRVALALALMLLAGCSRQPADCPDLRKVQAKPASAIQPRAEPGSALSRLRAPWAQEKPATSPALPKPPAKAVPVAKPAPQAKPKEPETRPKREKRKKTKRGTPRPQVARPQPQRIVDRGPDLPWACWQVRLAAAGRSRGDLETMGRQRGIVLTKKQVKQAKACLNGR